MAVLCILCALLVFLTVFSMSTSVTTTVEVTISVRPVTIGGILAIQCQIRNMEEGYTVRMLRVVNGQTEEISNGITYIPSSLGQRVFVSKRTMPGGNTVYFMTITDVSLLDHGEYLCKVYGLSGGDYVKVAEGSNNVEIYFLPNSIYPQCQSTPAVTENMNENVELKLTCLSSKGSPAVNLGWIDNLNQEIFLLG